MIRRLLAVLTVLLVPAAAGVFAITSSGTATATIRTATYNNTTNTVDCGAFAGKVVITPALALGGTSPTTITVTGTVYGCQDNTGFISGSKTANIPFTGKVAGTLHGTNNNLTSLAGCSSSTGNLTVTWKAYYKNGALEESLAHTTTVASLTQIFGTTFQPAPNSPYGATEPTTDGYGAFEIGAEATANGCTAPTETGGFLGTDSGATASSLAVTSIDALGILNGEATVGTTTTLGLGIGAYYSG